MTQKHIVRIFQFRKLVGASLIHHLRLEPMIIVWYLQYTGQ